MEKLVAKLKLVARKVVMDNLRKAAVISHDAEEDFKAARLMPPLLATEARWSAQVKAKKAETLYRHAAMIAADHGICTAMVPGQAKVGPVVIIKKGRGCNPGPSAVRNDTQPTSRRVASAS